MVVDLHPVVAVVLALVFAWAWYNRRPPGFEVVFCEEQS